MVAPGNTRAEIRRRSAGRDTSAPRSAGGSGGSGGGAQAESASDTNSPGSATLWMSRRLFDRITNRVGLYAAVFRGQGSQEPLPLGRVLHVDKTIRRPRELEAPVLIVNLRRLVDPIAPAEYVLDGEQQQVGCRAEQRLEQNVADGCVEGTIRDVAKTLRRWDVRNPAPLVCIREVPPDRHRLRVMRPARRDRRRRIVRRIAKRLAVAVPQALPSEDAKARDANPAERLAHEVGYGTKILDDDVCAGLAQDR